jgi:aspartyl protease family protein
MRLLIPFITGVALFGSSGCDSCSKSGRPRIAGKQEIASNKTRTPQRAKTGSGKPTSVKMEKIDGIYQIPVEVDGVKMFFFFDTGASIISISETEANFLLKQGKLTSDDIKGTIQLSDAHGDFSEGTIVNLKTVQIGDRLLTNVDASVVHNLKAPLLFGQSALEKFGKISIDNNKGEISFE